MVVEFTDIYNVKKISFSDWEKYVNPLLNAQDLPRAPILFYKIKDTIIYLSTSYDVFIICTQITFDDIKVMYKDYDLSTDGEVRLDQSVTLPEVKKFLVDYAARGIPEE